MKQINAAIIGCGVVAPEHARGYGRIEGVTVTHACDLVKEKAEKLAQAHGVPTVSTDYRQVLADPAVDCISICTDHGSHSAIAVDALKAGKHVLCEKALSADRGGLDAMLAEGNKHPNLVFSGVFQHRFDGVYRICRRLVQEGALGRMLLGSLRMSCLRTAGYYNADSWRGTWAQEGGAILINQSIHYIDELAWIMGGAQSVSGAWANIAHGDCMETEDTAVASLKFAGGALGSITATCSSNVLWEPVISLRGDKGAIDVRDAVPVLIDLADKEREKNLVAEFAAARDQCQHQAVKGYYGPSHPSQVNDFVAAIREKRRPFITAADASHAVDIVLGVFESHKTGKWVPITTKPANDKT